MANPAGGGAYSPKLACGNYNSFLNSSHLDSLKYFTDTIYPSGIIGFDLSKSQEYEGIESLYGLLEVDEGSTFELVKSTPSRFDPDRKYLRYQQYYQNVKVDGGGYTLLSLIPDNPGDPCEVDFLLSPFISSNINVSVTPLIDSTFLETVITNDDGINSELVITLNVLDSCQYHLAWKAIYSDDGGKISWVDAHTGSILKTVETGSDISAPTEAYGQQDIDVAFINGAWRLISNDGRIRTFDFESTSVSCPGDTDSGPWDNTLIPSTQNDPWTTNEASEAVYQAHYVTAQVLPILDNLGINFSLVDVASCSNYNNAFAINDNDLTTDNAFVKFGKNAGVSFAVRDIVAHELGHSYLFDFLEYSSLGNKTLHEAIPDMLGTYVESVIEGSTDWVMGDDQSAIASHVNRNLQSPLYDCYTDVENHPHHYSRGGPLRYWFYLISAGDSNAEIIALGIEKSIMIVRCSKSFKL